MCAVRHSCASIHEIVLQTCNDAANNDEATSGLSHIYPNIKSIPKYTHNFRTFVESIGRLYRTVE